MYIYIYKLTLTPRYIAGARASVWRETCSWPRARRAGARVHP